MVKGLIHKIAFYTFATQYVSGGSGDIFQSNPLFWENWINSFGAYEHLR